MVASAVVLGLVCVLSVVLRSELRRSKVPPSVASAVNPVPDGSMSMKGVSKLVSGRAQVLTLFVLSERVRRWIKGRVC